MRVTGPGQVKVFNDALLNFVQELANFLIITNRKEVLVRLKEFYIVFRVACGRYDLLGLLGDRKGFI